MANIFLLEDDKILSKGISIRPKKRRAYGHSSLWVFGSIEANTKNKSMFVSACINRLDGNGLEIL